ncbi:hypothetical protein NDU88_006201 [Pleurodeles waltl]|uniref:Uncharacterized protein n=1 Tax=Pleurodeles waltl TaxID=8319 RepID=A0AAV7WCS0_PLEWA|nr:hypothetical protein NDU88_006201 [Pleurodeles waltl]
MICRTLHCDSPDSGDLERGEPMMLPEPGDRHTPVCLTAAVHHWPELCSSGENLCDLAVQDTCWNCPAMRCSPYSSPSVQPWMGEDTTELPYISSQQHGKCRGLLVLRAGAWAYCVSHAVDRGPVLCRSL